MTSFKRGFTLMEIMVVVGLIGLLFALMAQVYEQRQATARDSNRITRANQIKQAIESQFFGAYFAYPLAGNQGDASTFEEASGVDPGQGANFKATEVVCTNRKFSKEQNKLWQWFGQYITDPKGKSPLDGGGDVADYKVWTDKIGGDVESKDELGGWLYKGMFVDGQFKYQVSIPLEKEQAKARVDGDDLGPKVYSFGSLVGTPEEIKKAEFNCSNWNGKKPYNIVL